jgi:hypothetical protein
MPYFNFFANSKGLYKGPLRPNCLLTRYPLIFLEKPKSLFSLRALTSTWKMIPSFTAEHGYEVHRIVIPDITLKKCQNLLIENLEKFNSPIHIVVGSDFPYLSSLTDCLTNQNLSGTLTIVQRPSFLKTKHRFELFNCNLWLDHLILLAELDYSMKNKVCHLQKMKFDPF